MKKNWFKIAKPLALIALMLVLFSTVALAADHTITKSTGTVIALPGSYVSGDNFIIKGDSLQTTPDDWAVLRSATANFNLVMQNNQTIIPTKVFDVGQNMSNPAFGGRKLVGLDLSGLTNLTTIGIRAFNEANLITVNLSGLTQLTSIQENAFNTNQALVSVDVSGVTKLKTIGNGAFSSTPLLREFNFPSLTHLETIEENAFRSGGLVRIDLSSCSNLQTIGDFAFFSIVSLDLVDLTGPSALTSIGDYAFAYSPFLRRLDFSGQENLLTLGDAAFEGAGFDSISSTNFLDGFGFNTNPVPALMGTTFDQFAGDPNGPPIYVRPDLVAAYKAAWPRYEARIAAKVGIDAPTANPPGGSGFTSATTVTLSNTNPEARIFYTLDGSDPITDPNGTRQPYTGPITVPLGATLKSFARTIKTVPSAVMTETYSSGDGDDDNGTGITYIVRKPIATPPGGVFSTPQTVTLTSATSGATIYYTLDGSDPITSPTRKEYTNPITIPMGTVLKSYAMKKGRRHSLVMTETYLSSGNTSSSSGCNTGIDMASLGLLLGGAVLLGKKKR